MAEILKNGRSVEQNSADQRKVRDTVISLASISFQRFFCGYATFAE